MMKLSAIFCVLFLASASQGSDTGGNSLISSITDIKNQVENTVQSAVANVQAAAEKGVSELTNLADSVSSNAVSTIASLQADIQTVTAKAESEIEGILSKVSANTAKTCLGLTDTLSTSAVDIVNEASNCVTEQVEIAYGQETGLKKEVKNIVSKLAHVSSATAKCVSDDTSLPKIINAFHCVNKQLATATVLSASSVISVEEKIAKLASVINNVQSQVPQCVVNDTLGDLTKQACNVVKDVRKCVSNLTS